jgi:hypothetical protein
MLGCGTLTIDSLGEQGPAVLGAVPGVVQVQTTLYELIEDDRDRYGDEDEDDEVVEPEPVRRFGRRRG